MTSNDHLNPLLDAYVAGDAPGFAIMVHAPWGAGKTFAVKSWLKPQEHLYISLFGLESPAAIDEAVFLAALERDGGKNTGKAERLAAKGLDRLTKLVGGALEKVTGATVDLSGMYRRAVLHFTPKLLVFDDLERAMLAPPILLSVINRFVEHEGKSVILIANEEELERGSILGSPLRESGPKGKSDYRRWREKVVGRTITLSPETDAALEQFLRATVDPQAMAFLTATRDLIRDVFDRSKTHNLRLLRQALAEFGAFYSRIPLLYRSQEDAMKQFLCDFLALSIAWHSGDRLTQDDFDFYNARMGRQMRRVNDKAFPKSGLEVLADAYQGAQYVSLDGSALPDFLARRLIIDGYATDVEIDDALKSAGAFERQDEQAWKTLWWWPKRAEAKVETALTSVEKGLSDLHFVDPAEILQVFGVRLRLSRNKLVRGKPSDVVKHAKKYILSAEKADVLRSPAPPQRLDRWLDENSDGLQYQSHETSEFKDIRRELVAALGRTWVQTRRNRLQTLLGLLRDDPDGYWRALNGGDRLREIADYRDDPVFLEGDPKSVVNEVFGLPQDRWSDFLSPIKERIEWQERNLGDDQKAAETERKWFLRFRKVALVVAKSKTPIVREQIKWAINAKLGFLDSDATD